MNFGQMMEAVARDIIQRDDVLTEALSNAFVFAQRDVQRRKNWRCMEQRTPVPITYPAGGVAGVMVDPNYKRARQVYLAANMQPLLPTTEDDASRFRRISYNTTGNGPDTRYLQRWYDAQFKLFLLVPPSIDTDLVVDFYGYLPFYSDLRSGTVTVSGAPDGANKQIVVSAPDYAKLVVGQRLTLNTDGTIVKTVQTLTAAGYKVTLDSVIGLADTNVLNLGPTKAGGLDMQDWFSVNMPEALEFLAAYYISKNIYEDGRADGFLLRANTIIQEAYADDVASKQGGLAKSYSPPTPGETNVPPGAGVRAGG